MASLAKDAIAELGQEMRRAADDLGADLARTAHDAGEAAKATQRVIGRTARAAYQDAREEADQLAGTVNRIARAHPWTVSSIAFGIGVLTGAAAIAAQQRR